MRRHYESLNYMDGDPASSMFRINRSQGSNHAVFENTGNMGAHVHLSLALTKQHVQSLRDMLNEVLEDWQ